MYVKVAVLSSGGKDSAAAIWWSQCKGWEVTHLVTMLVTGDDSMMFQIPGTQIVELQASACNTTWLPVMTDGQPESEVNDLQKELAKLPIDGIVSGALRSDYQKTRLERMCENLEIKSFTPLWHQSAQSHLRGLIENGFKIMITGVSSDGLDDEWLGKVLDLESYEVLRGLSDRFRFNIDGEGGEYETLVIDGPHMNSAINVKFEKYWDGKRGHLNFE